MQNVCWIRVASALTLSLSVSGALVGCEVDGSLPDSLVRRDMSMGSQNNGAEDMSAADLVVLPGSLGASCTSNAECMAGAPDKRRCWSRNLLEDPGNLATPGGYCSAECTKDEDCGGQGICATIDASKPKHCLQKCSNGSTCRHPEYACVVLTSTSGYCWPATRLLCNPTVGDGTCQGANPPAGCIRRAFEDLGECRQSCNIGINDDCPATDSGVRQHCVYINATRDTQGRPTRDKYKGTACFQLYADAKQENASCAYFDECQKGLQCNLSPGGDRKCHQLCVVGVAGACIDPLKCRDVFGAGLGGPGLCLAQ